MKYVRYITALSAIALSACSSGSVKDTLGLTRNAPDEFRVVSRPPLSVPPQFALRPPANSDASTNRLSADQKAQSLISGGNPDEVRIEESEASAKTKKKKETKAAGKPATGAESQFLKNAGADMADPKVRDDLVEEKFVAQEKVESESWWDVMSILPDKKDPLVDAKKEAERIQKNEDEGKPVTDGKTPEAKAKDRGVLGRLLGE